ncbi:MAG: PAS domain S-box protein [Chlorobium sp.]|uniref:PAS domain-containing protein n=1 Tax=Chlorobium sp. TaxID=1095 RepID=UPI0025C1C970|nr:PAS domain S-box protein [Chlorobium sp.]MCF8381972.1 PAS domain S-box protein [Chlorobium sp.]
MKDSEESRPGDAGAVFPEKPGDQEVPADSGFPCAGNSSGKQSEAYLQSILRAVPVGIGVVVNRIIMDANPRLCDILGYRREELVGHSSRMLYISEEDYEYVGREKYLQIAKHGFGTLETHLRCKDGRVIDALLSSSPVDTGDMSKGVTFTILDITAGKLAEIRLRESEEKYRTLVEQSIQGMIISRDNPPRICFASKPMEAIIGYTPQELMNFSSAELLDIVHSDDRESYYKAFRDRLSGRLQQIRREFRMVHKNGQVRWVELSGTTILYEGYPATQTVMVDITERKHAEKELLESGEKLKKLFDNIRDGLFVHPVSDSGVHGVFEMVNRSASEILGYTEQELLGMTPEDIYAPVFPGAGISREMSLLDQQGSQIFEAVHVHKNGARIPVEVRTSRIELSGSEFTISTVRDITGRKRSDEELKKIATALQQSPTVVVMMNAAAEVEYVNPRYTELTGYTAREVIGRYPTILQSGMIPGNIWLLAVSSG